MSTTKATLAVVIIVALVAVGCAGAIYYSDGNGGGNNNSDTDATGSYKITFENYKETEHPDTAVKYYVNGVDVTGQTNTYSGSVDVRAVATSSSKIYGLVISYFPNFDDAADGVGENVVTVDDLGNSTYEISVTVKQMFDSNMTVSITKVYYTPIGDTDDMEYTVKTTFHIQSGVTCTLDGAEVKDGQVLTLTSDAVVIAKSSVTGCLYYKASWTDGSSAQFSDYPTDEIEIAVNGTAFFENETGNVYVSFSKTPI